MSRRLAPGRGGRLVAGAAVVVLGVVAAIPRPGVATALVVALLALGTGLGRDGVRRGGLAAACGVVVIGVSVVVGDREWADTARQALFSLLRAGVPWLLGVAWRLRTQVRRQAAEHVADERRRRDVLAQRRRDAERLTLAESLHDDLGHALSLVALNLGRLELDTTLTPPARESVATARTQLGQAVERLGDSVAALRSGTAPGLPRGGDVDDLVAQVRRSGVDVDVVGMPAPGQLTDVDHETLHRVLQEALTNATKHAPGEAVTVEVRDVGDRLDVRVSNAVGTGGAVPGGGRGTGLASLGQHLRASGGRLDTRTRDGVFTLDARVPVRGADESGRARGEGLGSGDGWSATGGLASGAGPSSGGGVGDDVLLTRAGRRGRVVLGAAVVLVIGVLGAAEGLVELETSRSRLAPEEFARIHVGDTRDEVQHVLPAYELPSRPEADGDPDCHDYAITADRFADAAGDVYRVCFTGDVVAVTQRVAEGDR
jgi:signal transduction histidine kinase